MADVREVFPILEDASNVGSVPAKSQAGDSATGKVGMTVFGFRDSSGNLVLPQLNASGQVPVSLAASGTCLDATGNNAGSLTEVTVATITLTASEEYTAIEAHVACTRAAKFSLVHHDNGADTVLAVILTGPGQFSVQFNLDCLEFTAGATGTQELRVRGLNLDKAATMYATVACMQKP